MHTDTSDKIIAYISEKKEVTAKFLVGYLGISPQAVFKQLKTLVNKGVITKAGSPPKVFYLLKPRTDEKETDNIGAGARDFIEDNYLIITPLGAILRGVKGFVYWCEKNNLDAGKTAEEYAVTLQKYSAFRKSGLIDGLEKFKKTFPTVYLDEIYYLDFYSLERFGKTKLGALLLYAKQSQSRELTKEIHTIIKDRVAGLIKDKDIDAVGFIPPTISRKFQFQKEIEHLLEFELPKIKIIKVITGVPIPQKTLSRLDDRVENAASTIFVDDTRIYKNILLVDDAVGSGATFNETARKIKEKGLCSGKIIGLAVTGSFKGFDVLAEV